MAKFTRRNLLIGANAQRKYCANDVIPQYEAYYRQVLAESTAPTAPNTNATNTNARNTNKADAAGISPISVEAPGGRTTNRRGLSISFRASEASAPSIAAMHSSCIPRRMAGP